MIFFNGPPGSGKTTQAKLLAQRLNCPHFSVGALLRSELGEEQLVRMRKGELIDDNIVFPIIEKKFRELSDSHEVVVDGALRTLNDVSWLESLIKTGKARLTAVIFLELPDDEIGTRLLKRGRLDDSKKSIEERLEIYHESNREVKNALINTQLPFFDIDGLGTVDKVATRIDAALGV